MVAVVAECRRPGPRRVMGAVKVAVVAEYYPLAADPVLEEWREP
jgi:hypothetical protein